jgi:PTS system fructose-specific IIC component
MILCHYLTPDRIVNPLEGKTKEELLRRLSGALAEKSGIADKERFIADILDRESKGSTFLPTGIAIPHARVPYVQELSVVMGVIPEGFLEAEDSVRTYLILLFVSPVKETETGKSLKFLAKISATFREPEFVKTVAGMKNPMDIFSIIQRTERELSEKSER